MPNSDDTQTLNDNRLEVAAPSRFSHSEESAMAVPRYIHPATLDLLITGDQLVTRPDRWRHRRYLGTVDTHGLLFVNVVDDRGAHHAYRLEQIDRVA